MSSPVPPVNVPISQSKVTIKAHQSHWYDLVIAILKATSAANPIIAQFIPAPVEAGIEIATSVGPTVATIVEGVTNPPEVPQP